MRHPTASRIVLKTLTIALAIGLAACDNKEKAPASQLAASVNATEISVHQINFVLGRSNAVLTPEEAPRARREVLDKLIDQQLAIEQALEQKLDRTPEVLMALEAGRREILARAYVEQIVAAQPRPTVTEAKKYIADHPQLFAERRIFSIQEIILPAASGVMPDLREMLNNGTSMDEIASWLKRKDIKFSGNKATRAAEQIPLDMLPKLQALKDGQGLLLENTETITVMRLVASQAAPVAESVALPRVQQFLGNQRASEAVSNEFKQLKAKASISYQGEFASELPASPATASVVAPAAAPVTLTPNLEKGVAGIK
jgi:EpsD family peptidyl-prolyl cis-trans isomerase